jgi:hypothetical protein
MPTSDPLTQPDFLEINPVPRNQRITCAPSPIYSLIWTALAENAPGRQSWVDMQAGPVPPGTAENIPGHPSWAHSTENTSRGRNHVSQSYICLVHVCSRPQNAGRSSGKDTQEMLHRYMGGISPGEWRIVGCRAQSSGRYGKPRTNVLGYSQPSLAGLVLASCLPRTSVLGYIQPELSKLANKSGLVRR